MGGGCGIDAASLGRLIETLYQSVQNPDAWSSVMGLLCRHVHADSAMIRFYTPNWSSVELVATHGFDHSFNTAYSQHFVHLDPIPEAIEQSGLPPGRLAFLQELIPNEKLKHTEFYNDYLRPQDKHHVMGGYLLREGNSKALFGMQRGRRRRPFDAPDKAVLKILTPHFKQALRLHEALSQAEAGAAAAGSTLDRLNMAAFFLDRTGRIRFANAGAETEARTGCYLTVRQGRLHALHAGRDRSLQQLIEAVTATVSDRIPGAGGAVPLTPAHNAHGAVTALVTPWQRCIISGDPIAPSVTAAVLVGSCDRPILKTNYLMGAYGLTRSEARLVARLIETCSLGEAAAAAGITAQTARTYLKSVFRKAECRNQAELITKILTGPIGLWGRETKSESDEQSPAATSRRSPPVLRCLRR